MKIAVKLCNQNSETLKLYFLMQSAMFQIYAKKFLP